MSDNARSLQLLIEKSEQIFSAWAKQDTETKRSDRLPQSSQTG